MPTHNDDNDLIHQPEGHEPEEIDASHGYEKSDVRISGIVVFLTALSIFVAVAAVLSYGIGKALFAHMAREDGPRSKWAQTVDVKPLGNLAASPELQNKMAEMTQRFPAPRVQTDDGNQDVADLHAREDLLLENYSWADQSQGKVRIPIDRAMDILAKNGLPVANPVDHATLLTGDEQPTVNAPLTSGFARTGYELDQAAAQRAESARPQPHK
jgi:hypothetical protein